MLPSSAALLFGAAVVAGALNGVAGGGSFVSFPALLFAGVAPVAANATNTVAVWPAGIASAFAYREDLKGVHRHVGLMILVSLVGGAAGAVWLLETHDTTFVRLVPFLLLVASTVFTFGPWLASRFRRRRARVDVPDADVTPAGDEPLPLLSLPAALLVQLAISVYGGYFGGGMGIMMMAAFSLGGMTNIHAMNGLKNLLTTAVNGVAIAAFVVAGAVAWGPALVMVAGGLAGGYGGAYVAKRSDAARVRTLALVVAWGMTIYFFVKLSRGA